MRARLHLPENAFGRLDWREAVGIVLEAGQRVPWPPGGQHEGLSPQVMLTLLAYSYASGTYSSQEIEQKAANEAVARYICGSQQPGWQAIYWFRRWHRNSLKSCLTHVLRIAWERQRAAGSSSDSAGEDDSPSGGGSQAVPTHAWFAAEADARLQKAILADSMALDD